MLIHDARQLLDRQETLVKAFYGSIALTFTPCRPVASKIEFIKGDKCGVYLTADAPEAFIIAIAKEIKKASYD